MGLFDKIRGELIDIIEWLDDSRDTMVYRFPRYQNEIKMGAKLVVRESQTAVFVNEGQIADVFTPGTHTLETQNMPVLSTLKGWKYGFNSPFKAEVYFVSTRQFTELKWGTQNPIMLRDADFGMVRVRAFGGFSARVVDPGLFLKELVGTDGLFKTDEVKEYLRQMIVGRLAGALAHAQVAVLDLAANQEAIAARLAGTLTEELAPSGIAIPKFIIENVSLPPEVEAAMDKRTQMGVLGDLNKYTQFQTANAIENASNNPGGAGDALGIGLGVGLGQQAAAAMYQQPQAQAQPQHQPAGPPPLPVAAQWYIAVNGAQQGPLDEAGLQAQASSGALSGTTLVWKAGMGEWTPAASVPEVSRFLTQGPPPLPPQ
ncbi:SPFH domain-containing protein [Kineosporia succinea]|uniref:Membrane protease subunit (Stomatin/prohibitin family) n=1 Tax=Kineosporia succinea TaxID=84632 RepID=A0ABT9P894_9ACTN|nr:SPFH domain-containing protein [Kineosporia succinea]MDP9828925.1 membrane protease subunit (stomatin/prohibitin family) [Kineosporia succinea]